MKVKLIKPNQTELEIDHGIIVFFSYQTPVAVFVPGKGGLVSTTKYSRTTSKHIGQCLTRWGCSCTKVNQFVIDQYAQ